MMTATDAASTYSYALTPGNNGGTPGTFGYARGEPTNPGSLSPIDTLKGVNINRIRSSSSSEDLLVTISGVRAQTFWRMVIVQATDGTWRRYLSASATFSTPLDSIWSFGTGSSPVWTSTTAPRTVLFFL